MTSARIFGKQSAEFFLGSSGFGAQELLEKGRRHVIVFGAFRRLDAALAVKLLAQAEVEQLQIVVEPVLQ